MSAHFFILLVLPYYSFNKEIVTVRYPTSLLTLSESKHFGAAEVVVVFIEAPCLLHHENTVS